jgi:methyltransferase (TIGR00027 family)
VNCNRVVTGLIALPLLLVVGFAVEPGKPSGTAVFTLAARAIGSRETDPAIRNPDWLAERLLGPDELALLPPDNALRKAVDQDYLQVMKNPAVAMPVAHFLVRTRFIDENLEKAVNAGAVQVVILGAGFDSRAYRFRQLLSKVKVFELDFGPTQEYKKRRVLAALGPPPSNLVYVPIDFTRDSLMVVLRQAGYQPQRKTFFIWEGVTMYLPEEAVRITLQFVARNSAPGSSIVFDHLSASAVDPELASEPRRRTLATLRDRGEPQIFGLPYGTEDAFLSGLGLRLVTHSFAISEETLRYLKRRDGTLLGGMQLPILALDAPRTAAQELASDGVGWLSLAEVRHSWQ